MYDDMAIVDKRTALIFCFSHLRRLIRWTFSTLLGLGKRSCSHDNISSQRGAAIDLIFFSFFPWLFWGKRCDTLFLTCFFWGGVFGHILAGGRLGFLAVDDMLNFSSLWFYVYTLLGKSICLILCTALYSVPFVTVSHVQLLIM